MNKTNKTQTSNAKSEYFPEEEKHYVCEVPAQSTYIHQPKNPSGFTPIEHIHLEGQAFRQISAGRSPWWVQFTLWVLLGFPIFLVLLPLMRTSFWSVFPYILFGGLITLILIRGIRAKMRSGG